MCLLRACGLRQCGLTTAARRIMSLSHVRALSQVASLDLHSSVAVMTAHK